MTQNQTQPTLTRPMTRTEVIHMHGIEARCFYTLFKDGKRLPGAPWPRVPVGSTPEDIEAMIPSWERRRRAAIKMPPWPPVRS
jgi:hypothetical protein